MSDEKPLSETLKFKIGQIVQVNVGGNDLTWRLAYYQGWNYRGHYYSYTLNSAHYLAQDVREVNGIAALEQRLVEAESWRGQIDAFVRRIMDEVNCGKACGGLDWDQNNPQSTTQVVLDGIKAHTQAAIDAALIDLTHDLGSLYIHRNGHELYNSAIDDVARFIKGQLGTNPLAEAQARIAELEAENADLTKKLEAGWVRVCQTSLGEAYDRISELERELSEQADTIVDGLAKRRELERELAETRKDAERSGDFNRQVLTQNVGGKRSDD